MKKRIIIIFISLLSVMPVFAQLQASGVYRIANATTQFGMDVPKRTTILNYATGDVYVLMKNENATTTLSGLILGTDYVDLQLWQGNIFATYLNQPVLTTSSPTFSGLTVNSQIISNGMVPPTTTNYTLGTSLLEWSMIYSQGIAISNGLGVHGYIHNYAYEIIDSTLTVAQGIKAASFTKTGGTPSQFLKADGSVDGTAYIPLSGSNAIGGSLAPIGVGAYDLGTLSYYWNRVYANNFISNVATGTQPYAAISTTLNTNLNADLLDGQHGSYYLDYNNIVNTPIASIPEYIGMKQYSQSDHHLDTDTIYYSLRLADTTVQSGALTYSDTYDKFVIGVNGDYQIMYSFTFTTTSTNLDLIEFKIFNGNTLLIRKDKFIANNTYTYSITIVTTSKLTANSLISLHISHQGSGGVISIFFMSASIKKLN